MVAVFISVRDRVKYWKLQRVHSFVKISNNKLSYTPLLLARRIVSDAWLGMHTECCKIIASMQINWWPNITPNQTLYVCECKSMCLLRILVSNGLLWLWIIDLSRDTFSTSKHTVPSLSTSNAIAGLYTPKFHSGDRITFVARTSELAAAFDRCCRERKKKV